MITAVSVLVSAGPQDLRARTLASVHAHTPSEVRVIDEIAEADGDVAVLRAGCVVTADWLERLDRAARSDSIIATASPLVAGSGVALGTDSLDDAAGRLAARRKPLRPRLDAPAKACVYVRRTALELLGPLDRDFADRCRRHGLQHVLADDVLVAAEGERAPAAPGNWRLERALLGARRAVSGLSVTVDALCLRAATTGTQVYTLELIGALHAEGTARLRVLMPVDPRPEAVKALRRLEGIELLSADRVAADTPRSDVVHRPYQVTSAPDLQMLRDVGERIVITHLDLIAYRNRAYFGSDEAFEVHRRITRQALNLADLVVFGSHHAADDAIAEDLVETERTRTVPIGVDHRMLQTEPRPPVKDVPEPFLLCLGTDYLHKNRLFALRMYEALVENHAWQGSVIFAGARADHGRSIGEEEAWLAARPRLRGAILDLGPVGEAEKAWLLVRAAAVLYPSTYEGFGFIPFEAAKYGTPCAWAPVASLAEVLDPGLATLRPWDAGASAARVHPLLSAGPERERHVASVRDAAAGFTWRKVAGALRGIYEEAADRPVRDAAASAVDALAVEAERGMWEGRYWHLRNEIGSTGLALVGPEDPLLPDEAQRALAALARRRATRAPLLRMLRLFHGARSDRSR